MLNVGGWDAVSGSFEDVFGLVVVINFGGVFSTIVVCVAVVCVVVVSKGFLYVLEDFVSVNSDVVIDSVDSYAIVLGALAVDVVDEVFGEVDFEDGVSFSVEILEGEFVVLTNGSVVV